MSRCESISRQTHQGRFAPEDGKHPRNRWSTSSVMLTSALPMAHGHGKAHALVVRVPDADREVHVRDAVFQIDYAEHLHAIGHRVLLARHLDVPEAERL